MPEHPPDDENPLEAPPVRKGPMSKEEKDEAKQRPRDQGEGSESL